MCIRDRIEAAGYDPEADLENTADSVFCSHGAGYLVPWYQVKEYMHVESPVEKMGRRVNGKNEADGDEASVGKIAGGKRQSSSDPGTSWSDDRELEEIFNRRFGPGKRCV